MKKLVIVESPNKIKKIQEILGQDYIVLATKGHIMDLAKGGSKGIGIDIKNNFKPHFNILKDKMSIIDEIINTTALVDEVILCSDYDREGERIAFDLEEILKTSGKLINRAEFKEITAKGINEGLKNKRKVDLNLVKAQEVRRILDRIVGFMVSPFLMTYYGENLSAGRVQSVATRIIVDREKQIDDFKPEEYWNIHAKFKNQKGEVVIAKFDHKVSIEEDAVKIVDEIKSKDDFYVLKVKSQNKKEKPQPPLITAKLQQYMSRKYGYDPERTMRSAQNLYEIGYCTYIRTDSIRIADDAVKASRDWLKENDFEFPKTANIYSAKNSAQDAHECIRPTDVNMTADKLLLTGDDKEVYSTIWKFFVASQMNPAIYGTLNINIISKSNKKLLFKLSGKALEYKGYLEIFDDINQDKMNIPNLIEGEDLVFSKEVKSERKQTQPPPRYNDASINEELEMKQIGRPATFAEIIKKITMRNYVEKVGATYRPTELGKEITKVLVDNFSFLNYDFTANVEKLLDNVAEGKTTRDYVLNSFFKYFNRDLLKSYSDREINQTKCIKCNNVVVKIDGKFGKFSICRNALCQNKEKIVDI